METAKMYQELGISPEVYQYGEAILQGLKDRFEAIDAVAEYNQAKVIAAMQKNRVNAACFAATTGYGYDDVGRDTLEKVYADCFHTEAALVRPQITCGTHALAVALSANLLPGDELLSPVGRPYDTLEEVIGIRESKCSLKEYGVTYSQVDLLEDGGFDYDGIRAAINERTKAIVINSPNNPVGSVYAQKNLEDLAAALHDAQKRLGTQVYLISDEPYREITYGADVPWVPAIYDRTIVCYSYSKSLSLPGERIGWVLVPNTNPEHDRLVLAVAGAGRKLGFVCAPALFQHVVIDCVDEPTDVETYAENRRALTEGLSALGYEFIEPQGAFYLWVKALEPDANAFFERAKALELLPVPSDSFGCPGWVRVGYCVSKETIVNSMPAWKKLAESYE